MLRPGDPIPTVETYSEEPIDTEPRRAQLITYGSSQVGGLRQSKRIKYNKVSGRRRKITIHPRMTVKELKAKVNLKAQTPEELLN